MGPVATCAGAQLGEVAHYIIHDQLSRSPTRRGGERKHMKIYEHAHKHMKFDMDIHMDHAYTEI